MKTQLKTTTVIAVMGLLLAACGPIEIGIETPGASGDNVPTAAPTRTAAAPTAEPQPTPTPGDSVLPAPLYFIAQSDGQVWRVERNGKSVTQMTRERSPIVEFDVSPVEDALAYVTENTLVRTGAEGGNRAVLAIGPALTGAEGEAITSEIHAPRWSPDGQSIAYGLHGANLIPASGGDPQILQPSDPIPQTRQLARFYTPYAWSPDGARLLLSVQFWQEGLAYAVKNLADGSLREMANCCEPAWSRDGQHLYFSGESPEGYNEPGLWRVRADTGESETLIVGRIETSRDVTVVKSPCQFEDGRLGYLMAVLSPNPDGVYLWPFEFRLYRAQADGVSAQAVLRQEATTAWETLWAEDGRGLVVRVINPGPEGPAGDLFWLAADGSPAFTLPMTGANLRWGG